MIACRCIVTFFLALICALNSFATEDEASIRELVEESFLSGEVKPITREDLRNIGVYIDSQNLGESESVVQFSFSNKLMGLVGEKEFTIRFSIFNETEQLIASIPPYQEGSVVITEGYMLRMTVASKCNFMMLDKGTVYVFDYKNY